MCNGKLLIAIATKKGYSIEDVASICGMDFAEFNAKMRFADLCEEYFKVYAPNRLKPITAYNHEKMVNFHFIGYFGNKKLKDINTGMLTDFFCKMTTTKGGIEKPMAASTVKRIYNIMQSLMTFAVSQNYIKETPCKGVILPTKDCTKDNARMSLTDAELPEFIKLFDDYPPFNALILTLLYTGMRCGECLGLQWSDIDFDKRCITVKHSLSVVGGEYLLTTPKTKTSLRTIYMNETLCELLKKHQTVKNESFLT